MWNSLYLLVAGRQCSSESVTFCCLLPEALNDSATGKTFECVSVNFLSVRESIVYTMTSRFNEIVRVTVVCIIVKLYYTKTHSKVQNCSYEPVKEWCRDKLPMFMWLKISLSLVQSILLSSPQIIWEIYCSQVHMLDVVLGHHEVLKSWQHVGCFLVGWIFIAFNQMFHCCGIC